MDRLIRDALQSQPTPADAGPCIDAETLAAWADDVLDRSERARVDAHAAGCARCQALLAAMARTERAMDAGATTEAAGIRSSRPEARRRWRFAFWWLMPLGAAAAALLLWVAVPQPQRPSVTPANDRIAEVSAPPASSPDPKRAATPERGVPTDSSVRPRTADSKSRDPVSTETTQRQESLRAHEPIPKDRYDSDRPSTKRLEQPPSMEARTAAPSAPAAAAPLERRAAADAREAAPEVTVAVESPNGRTRWRARGTIVERSPDGGATWQSETTPARGPLLAGSSPSSSVCWFAGASGTVLLTTDGVLWRAVAFPDPAAELISIRATDDKTATVQTADGRRFSTADGGSTWTSLQEFPAAPFKE